MGPNKFPIMPFEPLVYFTSRYARSRGVRLHNFIRHSKIDVRNSAKYEQSCATLARLTGNKAASLAQHAQVRNSSSSRLFGQLLSPYQLDLEHPRFCPKCVESDVENGSAKLSARPYFRSHWMITAIVTCPVHDVALAKLPIKYDRYRCPDFSNAIHDNWVEVLQTARNPEIRVARNFDRYFSSRMTGGDLANEILDPLFYSDAISFCREVGALDVAGSTENRQRKSNHAEIASACAEGFDLIVGGFPALRDLLRQAARHHSAMSTGFGSILHHIAVNMERPGYLRIAELAREVAFTHTTAKRVLGQARSDGFTISSAVDTFNINPPTARKMFGPSMREDNPVIPIAVAEELASKWNDRIRRLPLSKFLNVNVEVLDEIEQAGLLVRHRLGALAHRVYLRSEVDAFLCRLVEHAALDPSPEMQPLLGSQARISKALMGIIDGKVRAAVLPGPGPFNLGDLLAHRDDLHDQRSGKPPGTQTTGYVQMKLRVSANLLRNLERASIIERVIFHDEKGRERILFKDESIEAYNRMFVSVRYLARTKSEIWRVEKRLEGIQPVFDFGGTDRVYRRQDIQK
ncbi:TniQ family protein [Neorhizobium tomejilense]|uniref:TniQ family protein n=1 Tax=Neorhizobium tomejilense TaxID=2093828 RepID=UPI000CF85443|nr:TniQ family protein [Neorhizobium tomejilense]